MITKDGKKWKLDFRPQGAKGSRIIRLFDTKGQALQCQRKILSDLERQKQNTDHSVDDRTLTDLINTWYDLHGQSLKSANDTKNRLLNLSVYLGEPQAKTVNPELLAKYRKARLEQGVTPATLNRELTTLKAMYRELKRLGVIDYNSTILDIRKLRETKTELSYLNHEQITKLLLQVNKTRNDSLPYVVKICLATGARWSEAEKLTYNNCINQGFQFVDTKNSHSRFVPVDGPIFSDIQNRLKQTNFKSCYSAFRSAFKRTGLTVLCINKIYCIDSNFVENCRSLWMMRDVGGLCEMGVHNLFLHFGVIFCVFHKMFCTLLTRGCLSWLYQVFDGPIGCDRPWLLILHEEIAELSILGC